MYYKKISVEERFPEIGKFVTTIDTDNQHRVYRLTEYGWNMRDADGINSPNNNLCITHWLEEVDLSEVIDNARKWTEFDEELGKMFADDSEADLIDIGELTCERFGYN